MACPAILTGVNFLGSTLAHIDCQAQSVGAYGYGALADPGSTVSLALAGLLTIFVALFGLRLLLGYPIEARDMVGDVIKVAIVLTLATSWPAWRVIGYDVVMNGPTEVAKTIGLASGLAGGADDLRSRLQNADDGLVAITVAGTGRQSDAAVAGPDMGDSFHGIALPDQTGLGWGRVVFLAATLGPFAILRLGAGILLALTPLMAGLLLFGGTMGLFVGWLRGLAFSALGGVAFTLVQGVELAILEPWIAGVLAQRAAGGFAASAPTELMVLALAFGIIACGTLWLLARVAFQPHFGGTRLFQRGAPRDVSASWRTDRPVSGQAGPPGATLRAHLVSDAVATTMRREETGGQYQADPLRFAEQDSARPSPQMLRRFDEPATTELLGSGFRRSHIRSSAAARARDGQTGARRP